MRNVIVPGRMNDGPEFRIVTLTFPDSAHCPLHINQMFSSRKFTINGEFFLMPDTANTSVYDWNGSSVPMVVNTSLDMNC